MPGSTDEVHTAERKRDKVGEFLQSSYNKGELALKHGIGLGNQQQVIPPTEPITNGPSRPVEVGWHPVGGFAGKWFAEKTGLGKMITEKTKKYPDPTQHWAVLVGDYAHQLWMDEEFHVIYTNERVDAQEWMKFQVGETTFNDDAIRRAGETVIQHLRDARPGYNLITNNCQTYVLQLLDAIKVSNVKEFGTTLAVYDRIFGEGKVADLFPEMENHKQEIGAGGQMVVVPTAPLAGQEVGVVGSTGAAVEYYSGSHQQPTTSQQNTVLFAQQVMNDNTPQLDCEEEAQRGLGEHKHGGKDGGWKDTTSSLFRKFKKKDKP
ncbi:hypothetical protein P154DRAFT_519887 [Amniculicola lignicola CBS 123094]|uniref:DUF862-domain-containing protein n=1 Tax=Amniculicola lignicola CBS 123094 TaxID=1392246 RepID=A0A6A5WRG0_9PLEO|nr:hypothetical protein P154DRAFT_519887 [Amniculicola lignicola CBS 123094]